MRTVKTTNGFEIIVYVNQALHGEVEQVAVVVEEAGRRQAGYLAGCGMTLVTAGTDCDPDGDHVALVVELDDDHRHRDVLAAAHEVAVAVEQTVNTALSPLTLAADAADNGWGVISYGGETVCLDRDLCPECGALDWTDLLSDDSDDAG